jgi:hypothetical protein
LSVFGKKMRIGIFAWIKGARQQTARNDSRGMHILAAQAE